MELVLISDHQPQLYQQNFLQPHFHFLTPCLATLRTDYIRSYALSSNV